MKVMRVDALTADHITGRNVRTSHSTCAKKAATSPALVKRSRQVAECLGLMTTVDRGRYLTQEERQQVLKETGFGYTKKASTRSLTMTREWAVQTATDHLPRSGSTMNKSSLRGTNQKRSRVSAASRINEEKPTKNTPRPLPRDLSTQKLAAGLERQLFWLTGFGHIGRLCDVLTNSGLNPATWTPSSLSNALNAFTAQRGWTTPHKISNPLAYLSFLLTAASLDNAWETFNPQSKAREAMKSTQAAKEALEARNAPEHKINLRAGIAKLREVLKTSKVV
ncbi:hypothetical protein [Arthrobacter glacialis]|uniref:hypothetical protein n=1 Tax=Arthrobacter glacialis TaxID=1664 RepID=UPI001057465F|nr:hypothetical protein [Arthrobacter glacialis]